MSVQVNEISSSSNTSVVIDQDAGTNANEPIQECVVTTTNPFKDPAVLRMLNLLMPPTECIVADDDVENH